MAFLAWVTPTAAEFEAVAAFVGSGGVIAATDGKDVELPAGTIVRIRMDSPVQIR